MKIACAAFAFQYPKLLECVYASWVLITSGSFILDSWILLSGEAPRYLPLRLQQLVT